MLADRIVAVLLEPAEGAALGGRWRNARSPRLMVCCTLPADSASGKAAWQEAAVCAKERGEAVSGTLLDAMGLNGSAAHASRYIYPARTMPEGWVSHWQVSASRLTSQRTQRARHGEDRHPPVMARPPARRCTAICAGGPRIYQRRK